MHLRYRSSRSIVPNENQGTTSVHYVNNKKFVIIGGMSSALIRHFVSVDLHVCATALITPQPAYEPSSAVLTRARMKKKFREAGRQAGGRQTGQIFITSSVVAAFVGER